MVEETIAAYGKVDILVNNAGIARDQLVMRMSEEDWDKVLNVDEFKNFSADTVQDALIELDALGLGAMERHQDEMHATAVVINERGESRHQINLSETTLASTIFQTETGKATNILQCWCPMRSREQCRSSYITSASTASEDGCPHRAI
jgi:NAD(P)-dependent dehydrogenase (short-subunit alcohol dehydrogenase family)